MVTIKFGIIMAILMTINAHTPKNNSDVIVTYEGHAEVLTNKKPTKHATEQPRTTKAESNEVIFVPNERDTRRKNTFREDDGYLENREVRISDLIEKKTVDEMVKGRDADMTEPPPDVFFVKGKNNDQPLDNKPVQSRRSQKESEEHFFFREKEKAKPLVVDCSNLDCNNTVQSVCGGKMEHKRWKYRLFKNECYFRKVNCAFSYEENRYISMPIDRCQYIGSHYAIPHIPSSGPIPIQRKHGNTRKEEKKLETRRFVASRRSMSISLNGGGCDHSCPVSCPDDYDPQCAVSVTGHRKVFVNHCKVDLSSCANKAVWYLRPLTECVGDQKADLHQNRAFIGWMQRVGIVDKKGKLVLS